MESKKRNPLSRNILLILAWSCVVGGVGLIFWGYSRLDFGKEDLMSQLSSLGSFYSGSVGSLLTLASLLFVVITLHDQQTQMAEQEASIQLQNFSTAFFQLLKLHSSITDSVRESRGPLIIRPGDKANVFLGRVCFTLWHNDLKIRFNERAITPELKRDKQLMKEVYLGLYRSEQAELAHYFRNLYHIFKFIKFSGIPAKEKKRYASLARAQLSAYELALLFYNGITPIPPEPENKFKELIEEFGLFENLDKNLLLDPSHEGFYNRPAYQ